MKTIGLIGGMSWESTVTYYQIINEEISRQLGGLHSAQCVLYSVDFAVVEAYQARGDWDKAGYMLAQAAEAVEKAGADFIVLCTNTMHKVIHHLEAAVQIPVLHIGEVTANAITKHHLNKVGLIGTAYTMEQNFYIERMKHHAIDVLVPDGVERETINNIIFEELCHGHIRDTSRTYMLEVINGLMRKGAEGIVLGCTEISLLVGQADTKVPLFDTTSLHAKAAAHKALAD